MFGRVVSGLPSRPLVTSSSSLSLRRSPKFFPRAPIRRINIHEYLSSQLLNQYGVQTPRGRVAKTVEEAISVANEIQSQDFVIKAQVLAGGRGLGTFTNGFQGGVHVASSTEEVGRLAEKMLGQTLVTKQTGAGGRPVDKVYVVERVYARRELYFAILMDRENNGPTIVASRIGGGNIEDVAKKNPDAIIKSPIDAKVGPSENQFEDVAKKLGFNESLLKQAADQFRRLYQLFMDHDCTLLEINPLVETPDGKVLAADCKLNFDSNAAFRQKEIFSLRDETQEDPREVRASHFDLNYIGLDGNIGCIVNGAGLAMATMDIIKLHGGSPANFLDVGGGASEEQVKEAFKLLASDKQVKAIFVNIFGGIMRCDVMAAGIIKAAAEAEIRLPMVVRLKGTREAEAKALINSSGLRLIPEDDLDEAAKKAVQMAKIVGLAEQMDVNVKFEIPI